jgi:DNA-binding NtrC family response regulator
VLIATGGESIEVEHPLWVMGCVVLPLAASADDASSLLRPFRPDVVLVDVQLGRRAVIALVKELADMDVPFAVITAPGDDLLEASMICVADRACTSPSPSRTFAAHFAI